MKKAIGIIILGLGLSFAFTSPSFAKWCVNPNYENLTDEELLGGVLMLKLTNQRLPQIMLRDN